jgi:hypothetical protein
VSLKAAREGRDAARKVREAGTDPVQARKVERAAAPARVSTTFEDVARESTPRKSKGGATSTPSAGWSGWRQTCSR